MPFDQTDVLEHWLPIEGYSRYECSDQGRIRTINTKTLRPKRLNPRWGYCWVSLKPDNHNQHRTVRVTTIISKTWLGPTPPGYQVDHKIEDNKSDDRVSNLQFLTQSENILKHKKTHKAHTTYNTLSVEFHAEVKRLWALGYSQCAIARHLGCDNSTCSKILSGKTRPKDSTPTGQVFPAMLAKPTPRSVQGMIFPEHYSGLELILQVIRKDPHVTVRELADIRGVTLGSLRGDIRLLRRLKVLDSVYVAGKSNTWLITGSLPKNAGQYRTRKEFNADQYIAESSTVTPEGVLPAEGRALEPMGRALVEGECPQLGDSTLPQTRD